MGLSLPSLGVRAAIASFVIFDEAAGITHPRFRAIQGAALLTLRGEAQHKSLAQHKMRALKGVLRLFRAFAPLGILVESPRYSRRGLLESSHQQFR